MLACLLLHSSNGCVLRNYPPLFSPKCLCRWNSSSLSICPYCPKVWMMNDWWAPPSLSHIYRYLRKYLANPIQICRGKLLGSGRSRCWSELVHLLTGPLCWSASCSFSPDLNVLYSFPSVSRRFLKALFPSPTSSDFHREDRAKGR